MILATEFVDPGFDRAFDRVDGETSTALAYGGGGASYTPAGWTPPAIALVDPAAVAATPVLTASAPAGGCGGRCQEEGAAPAPTARIDAPAPAIGPLLNETAGSASSASSAPAASWFGLDRVTLLWFGAVLLLILVLAASARERRG